MGQTENKELSEQAKKAILAMQQDEITEYATYTAIAKGMKPGENRATLERLAAEELAHYEAWKRYTGKELKPQALRVWWRCLMAKITGFTFAVKLMERREIAAQSGYTELGREVPESITIAAQEEAHEEALLALLDEERLRYVGSMVLGLNDALVELTGTLAGLTLAMQNTRLIALSGLITGISATLSMASSEFLSSKSEGRSDALKSCIYTGIAYVITVILLILPYLLFPPAQYMLALGTMLIIVVLIILVFNFYVAVAKDLPFKRRFTEMAAISLGVAALSFVVGLVVKNVLGIDV